MEIKNDIEYETALSQVYKLMNKPEENITNEDLAVIDARAKAIEYYEDHVLKIMPIKRPK
jgi:antitoxin component HigA of HigAB toxin-antitoxin module